MCCLSFWDLNFEDYKKDVIHNKGFICRVFLSFILVENCGDVKLTKLWNCAILIYNILEEIRIIFFSVHFSQFTLMKTLKESKISFFPRFWKICYYCCVFNRYCLWRILRDYLYPFEEIYLKICSIKKTWFPILNNNFKTLKIYKNVFRKNRKQETIIVEKKLFCKLNKNVYFIGMTIGEYYPDFESNSLDLKRTKKN